MVVHIIFAILLACVSRGSASPIDHPISPFAANYIVDGSDAEENAAPYQVSLQIDGNSTCSGSIVGDRWILTAEHCVPLLQFFSERSNNTRVVAGTNDLKKGGTPYFIDRFFNYDNCSTMLVHTFMFNSTPNDIALIRLTTPLKFNQRVKKIEFTTETVPENATLTLTGWGQMRNGTSPAKLQTINAPSIRIDHCRAIYNETYLNDGTICSLSKRGEGACMGDSGGPVTWKGKLVGIFKAVHNKGCGEGFPDIHTSVAYYYKWIKDTIANNSV
ncbi:AGAP005194-PA [Anopheles gambiae str. PEST]|uniref:Mating-regulated atrial protease 1 n=1 Tax=Anopheles gambiae TaxID=7165 RepID=MRAP1_ANOGA|nr:AGAP005194-PA [Anopheles gambiae str. PEST]